MQFLRGLKGSINREDLPDEDTILTYYRNNQMHFLSLPFLAGLAEYERLGKEEVPRWDEGMLRTALANHYVSAPYRYCPGWYRWLLNEHPKTVAEVFTPFVISEFKSSSGEIRLLHELPSNAEYRQVARLACLRLVAVSTRSMQS